MLADHGEKIGLVYPEVGAADFDTLSDLLPDIATVSNPLDYTTPIWGQSEVTYPIFSAAIAAMGADSAVLVQDYPAEGLDESKINYQNDADAFARAAREQELPAAICATLPENIDAQTRNFLIAEGVAPMQGIHETLNAIEQAAGWTEARTRILATPPEPLARPRTQSDVSMLTEDEGKAWAISAGVSVPEGRSVKAADAAGVAQKIGFPVALKMMSPDLAHKTEAGAVALGIADTGELAAAIDAMRVNVRACAPSAVTDRFLVEKMSLPPLAELIVGIRRDPQFGAALTLGSGGILVELVGDAKTLLLPCSPANIREAIAGLKVGHLLAGFRGRQVADLDRIASKLHTLCRSFLEHSDTLAEIEINPMFVYHDQVVAVDILMHKVVL